MLIAPIESAAGVSISPTAKRGTQRVQAQRGEQMQRERRDQRHAEPGRVGIGLDRRERGQEAPRSARRSPPGSRSRGACSRSRSSTSAATSAASGNVAIAIAVSGLLRHQRNRAAASRAHARARSATPPDPSSRRVRAGSAARARGTTPVATAPSASTAASRAGMRVAARNVRRAPAPVRRPRPARAQLIAIASQTARVQCSGPTMTRNAASALAASASP